MFRNRTLVLLKRRYIFTRKWSLASLSLFSFHIWVWAGSLSWWKFPSDSSFFPPVPPEFSWLLCSRRQSSLPGSRRRRLEKIKRIIVSVYIIPPQYTHKYTQNKYYSTPELARQTKLGPALRWAVLREKIVRLFCPRYTRFIFLRRHIWRMKLFEHLLMAETHPRPLAWWGCAGAGGWRSGRDSPPGQLGARASQSAPSSENDRRIINAVMK